MKRLFAYFKNLVDFFEDIYNFLKEEALDGNSFLDGFCNIFISLMVTAGVLFAFLFAVCSIVSIIVVHPLISLIFVTPPALAMLFVWHIRRKHKNQTK